jgi:N-acyl-D-aspartate/D-glutamate deacylase
MTWDLLVRGGLVFDGNGGSPRVEDVAIAGGRVVARGPSLTGDAARVVDASGRWVTPGLLDVHTHYDLEVELDPRLPESLRHGTTTVVMSNCSLGLAFGNQRRGGADPIVDCFARVENIPKPVLAAAGDVATWTDPAGYLAHLDALPLGPNVVPMIPHSMLRVEVMGLEAAISRDPTPAELDRMASILGDALDRGYVGFSTDALPFHYLANDPNRRRKIPTQYAGFAELRRLTDELRRRGRVWQTTPPKDSPLSSLRNFLLSSGWLFGRTLKITAVAAMDVVPNRWLLPMARTIARLLNGRLDGDLRFQALAARFKVWCDGAVTPIAEEVEVLRELNEPDLEDRAARVRVVSDPAWQARFRAWWTAPRRPGVGWLKRRLRYEDTQFDRDLAALVFDRGPVPAWSGEPMAAVHARLLGWQRTGEGARDEAEAAVLAGFPAGCDEVDFLVHLWRTWDTDCSWWTVSANADEATVERVLLDETFLPGFADSGAHITNMAFYDVNLRALRIAAKHGPAAVGRMVERLTREPAAFFGLDVGTLDVGAPADLVVIDPAALSAYDGEARVQRAYRDVFRHEQLVNRSDGVVRQVVVGGRVAWDDGFTAELGTRAFGRCLRAVDAEPGSARLAAK